MFIYSSKHSVCVCARTFQRFKNCFFKYVHSDELEQDLYEFLESVDCRIF